MKVLTLILILFSLTACQTSMKAASVFFKSAGAGYQNQRYVNCQSTNYGYNTQTQCNGY
jgi:hypothetical protein